MPVATVNQIRLTCFLICNESRIDSVRNPIRIQVTQVSFSRLNQRAVILPFPRVEVIRGGDSNCTISDPMLAYRVEAVEFAIFLDGSRSPRPSPVLFFDNAGPVEDGSETRPRAGDIWGFEDGEVMAAAEEVEGVVVLEDVGVVDGDVAGVWERVGLCVGEMGEVVEMGPVVGFFVD